MDPREYLDARWYALVRTAVDLGVPEEEAPALVQRVLAANTRRIRRAEDPDPLVHEALREAALGPPPPAPQRRRWPAVALLAAALVVAGAAVAVTRPDDPPSDRLDADQVPSLFGYDAESARALLEGRGLDVTLRQRRACEVLDRVLGSIPPAGATYDRGDDIVVYTSLPADVDCLSDYTDRETAWRLLDFANGRAPAPAFADRVYVYAAHQPTVVLPRPSDPDSWRSTDVLRTLRAASAQVALVDERPLTYSLPAIRVTRGTYGLGVCGSADRSVARDARHTDAFAMMIRPPGGKGCGVMVAVYRDERRRIDAIALYEAPSSAPSS